MKPFKIKTKSGTKWRIEIYTAGRGSKRIVRVFDSRIEAENFIHEYKARKNQLMKTAPDVRDFEETTFREEADYWLKSKRHIHSPGHARRASDVQKNILPRLGSLRPNRITPGLLDQMGSEGLNAGIKPASVNRMIEVVKAVLNYSVQHRRIPYSPVVSFKKLKLAKNEMQHLEPHEVERLLAFANEKYPIGSENRWKYAVYLLAINCGLRAGEIWGLKAKDLRQEDEVILIERQFDRLKKTYRLTKGRKARRVPCNEVVRGELKSLITRFKIQSDEPIFLSETRTPIDHDNFKNRVFDVDLREVGLKKIRFHDLRHTAITLMVANNIEISTVQAIAGHEDLKTTSGYTHLVASRIKEVARTHVIAPKLTTESKKVHLQLVSSN